MRRRNPFAWGKAKNSRRIARYNEFLVSLSPASLATWLKAFLRDGIADPLDAELAADDAESFVISLADRQNLVSERVSPSVADDFIEGKMTSAIVDLIGKWTPAEGATYFGRLVRLAAYFSAIESFPEMERRFNDNDTTKFLSSEGSGVHVDLLGSLISIAKSARRPDTITRLLQMCKNQYIHKPAYTSLCFRVLKAEYPAEVVSEFLPNLVLASFENGEIRFSRILAEYLEICGWFEEDEDGLVELLETVASSLSVVAEKTRKQDVLLNFLEELFIAGLWLVPAYEDAYAFAYEDELKAIFVYRALPSSKFRLLYEIDEMRMPTVWGLIDARFVVNLTTSVRGFEMDLEDSIDAFIRRSGNVSLQ